MNKFNATEKTEYKLNKLTNKGAFPGTDKNIQYDQ